jgi:hypothetical protein
MEGGNSEQKGGKKSGLETRVHDEEGSRLERIVFQPAGAIKRNDVQALKLSPQEQ